MKIKIFILLISLQILKIQAQVLVYSEIGQWRNAARTLPGWKHPSIADGIAMFKKMGIDHNITFDFTDNSNNFTDAGLAPYKAIVFLNTNGYILNASERLAFQKFIRGGKGYVGIHAASNCEQDWPWYKQLIGSFETGVHANALGEVIVKDATHISTKNMPAKFNITDEWLKFDVDVLNLPDKSFKILTTVNEKSYDPNSNKEHSISWYHEFEGGRAWYTGMGHNSEPYRNPIFIDHVWGGLQYAMAPKKNVLIFSKTNGFRHEGAIAGGIRMITELGTTNGWNTVSTENPADFNAANLAKYDVVVWGNTSGNNLLNSQQKTDFQNFIRNGGGFVGIHAASNTYDDKSWSWYNDLVGAIVQTCPYHINTYPEATMDVTKGHEIVADLQNTWTKKEEWYYWGRTDCKGYLYSGNKNLLTVRSTGPETYDAARPVAWYKDYDGGRSFYTALGHKETDYTSNSDFGRLIRNAILWTGKAQVPSTFTPIGPDGYSYSTPEFGSVTVTGTMDIAFGSNGNFVYLRNQKTNVNCNVNTFTRDPAAGTAKFCWVKESKTPYSGTSIVLPGIIEAENYDKGGEGTSYKDNEPSNQGNVYRTDGVDVLPINGGFALSWIAAGEWTEYMVDVKNTNKYDFEFKTSAPSVGGSLSVNIDGNPLFTNVAIPSSSNWNAYNTFVKQATLIQGKHVLRFKMEKAGFNLDKITVKTNLTTDVDDLLENETHMIYPNHSTTGVFQLDNETTWEVYSTLGQKVMEGKGKMIDLSSQPKNIYMVKISGTFSKILFD